MEHAPGSEERNVQPIGTLWLRDLHAPAPPIPAPRTPATFERAHLEQAASLAQQMGVHESAGVQRRLAAGRRCYIARVEGALAAYGWLTLGPESEEISELDLRIRLAPGEAYIWDCATVSAYRGQRLYPALLGHIASVLQAEGLARVWIGADSDNVGSQHGIALAGFQPIADVLPADVEAGRRFDLRGRPGAPEDLVRDACYALFGERTLFHT